MRSSAYGLLAVIFVGAALSACGNGSGDDDEADSSPTPEGATPGVTESPSASPSSTSTPEETTGTPGETPSEPPSSPSPTPSANYTIDGGNVSGEWCGNYTITKSIVVIAGASLHVCEGSTLVFNSQTGLKVEGNLELDGSSANRIGIKAAATNSIWSGITVSGKLDARYVDLQDATVGVSGQGSSTILLSDSRITRSQSSLQLANGATLDHVDIVGGQTVLVSGGMFNLSNSSIDLLHNTTPPDCVNFNAGGAMMDHVYITGCHCALHINAAPLGIQVTHSTFEGTTNPMMIAKASAVVSGSNLTGTGSNILDIGGSISAVVSGNYWGGGAPDISTGQPSQFVGADVYSSTPFADAGVQ